MRGALATVVGGFFIGVAVRSAVPVDVYVAGTLLLTGIAGLAVAGRLFHYGLYAVLVLCACTVGIVRTEFAVSSFVHAQVLLEGSSIERAAVVRDEPDIRETHTLLTLTLDRMAAEPDNIVVRVRVPHYPAVAYGDRVVVRGTVRTPEPFETDTGRTFDYRTFLMKDGIHYELAHADISPLQETYGNSVVRALISLKHAWLNAVSRAVPEPSASLLGGVVVGAKRSLGDAWLDAFRDTGIVHIIVLSGYNLTLVALCIAWFTRPLSRTARLVAGIAAVCAFALMTGGGATVVRASVMAVLGMVALFLARPYAALRALIVAAFLMVCVNPFLLMYDPGFQLSCVATVGLILGTPYVERLLTRIPERVGLRTIIATTLATQCAVAPLLAYHVGEMSLVAPIVNILVLPVIPLVMALGFVTGVVGTVLPGISAGIGWIAYVCTSYVFTVVSWFASFQFAAVQLPPIPAWLVVLAYGVLGACVFRLYKQNPLSREGGWFASSVVSDATQQHRIARQ